MSYAQGLEIRSSAGVLLGAVTDFTSGQWVQAVNVADKIIFTAPTATLPAAIVHGNEVWLRQGDAGGLRRKFVITEIAEREGERAETEVIGYDYLSTLALTTVTDYPSTTLDGTDINVRAYLNDLLALQSVIHWGTYAPVESDYTLPYSDLRIDSATLLEALHRVRAIIGGMLWVDTNKKLHWYTNRFPKVPAGTYTLDLDRNMIGYSKRDNRITGTPELSYDVQVVDMSQISGEDDGMLNVGMPVTLTPTGETLYITDITQDLHSPLALQIAVSSTLDLSGRAPDLVDAIVSIVDDLMEGDREIDVIDQRLEDFIDGFEEAVADIIEVEAPPIVDDAIAALYGSDIQPVAAANAAGDSNKIAREDHEHSAFETVPTFATTKFIPWFALAKVSSMDAGGNTIQCNLYNWATSAWETSAVTVYKPYVLRPSTWDGNTFSYVDSTSVSYDDTDLDITYQRNADYGDDEEVQEITSPYFVGEYLWLMKTPGDVWHDMNAAGRHWGATK
jgi:hypothetical protein